jgi:hypothetical protein
MRRITFLSNVCSDNFFRNSVFPLFCGNYSALTKLLNFYEIIYTLRSGKFGSLTGNCVTRRSLHVPRPFSLECLLLPLHQNTISTICLGVRVCQLQIDMAAFDPDSDELPKLSDLKSIHGAPQHAAWFWGEDDEVRTTVSWCIA